jgi:hypothetical protein
MPNKLEITRHAVVIEQTDTPCCGHNERPSTVRTAADGFDSWTLIGFEEKLRGKGGK